MPAKRPTWDEMEKKPLTPEIKMLYSESAGEYIPSDYIDDWIEDMFSNHLIDSEVIPESNWPKYFELVLCQQCRPPYFSVSDEYYDFIGFAQDDEQTDPPSGWEEIEQKVNEWIDRSEWAWESTYTAWNGEYVELREVVA